MIPTGVSLRSCTGRHTTTSGEPSEVKDHPRLMEDVGYRLELTGVVDEKGKTVSVRSVKRLSEIVQMCRLPKTTTSK